MENENVFLKHKLLIGLFFISFFTFVFFHCKYSLGLYFDIPAMMLGNISQDDSFSKFIIFPDQNIRYFTNFLVAIPFNISMVFLKNTSAINILKAFSLSYLTVHFFGLLINYLIALRTKRYDIAAICFAFYTFFSVQNLIWTCREVHIAIFFYFALLSYFLSKTKLGLKDLLPIMLIIIYLFESFEITMVFGLLIFIFSILYTNKTREEINRWHKVLIGMSGLLMFLYIPIKTLFMSLSGHMNLSEGTNEWLTAAKITIENLFTTNSLITIFALISFLYILFQKQNLGEKGTTIIVSAAICLIFLLWKITGFIPRPMTELQNYSFVFWFIFPAVLTILMIDYNKKQINPVFISNLIVISCITGVIGLCWQINTCFEFNKYISYLKKLISEKQETIITIPKEDFENHSFLSFNTCFGTMHKSVFLSDEYVIKKLIVPSKEYPDYTQYCMTGKEHNFYDAENDFLYIQTSPLRIKNKYWDISEIKDHIEEINN